MSENPKQQAFDLINRGLTDNDVKLLRIITGKLDRDRLLDYFFSDLNNYRAIYKFPRWQELTISEQKEMLNLNIRAWYTTWDIYQEEFVNSWSYSSSDENKFEIVVAGLGLVTHSELNNYLDFLYKNYENAFDDEFSIEYREWLKVLIENTKRRMNSQENESTDKWEPLRQGLLNNQFITETPKHVFYDVMEYHNLPGNENRIRFGEKMKKAYAVHFSDHFLFSDLRSFMQCFNIEVEPHDRPKTDPPKKFTNLYNLAPSKE